MQLDGNKGHTSDKKPVVLPLLCCPKIDQRAAANLEKRPQIQQGQVTHVLQQGLKHSTRKGENNIDNTMIIFSCPSIAK